MTARFRLSALCAITATAACSTPSGPTQDAPTGPTLRAPSPIAAAAAATRTAARASHSEHPRRTTRPKWRQNAPYSSTEVPQAVSLGGTVMSSPKVVPILFPGDPYDAQVRDFFTKLSGSSYWTETVSEYGVGPVTVLPPYVPTFAASEDTPAWLTAFLANPPAGVPAPDDNTIYAIVYPPGWGADEGACVYFGADHYFTSMPSGQNVIFTENPICPNGYIGLSGLDNATFGLSHEITESVTDPLAETYIAVNWALSGWASADEGSAYAEVADLREFQPNAAYLDPGIGHVVTRIWSNASIAAGHDPCRPLLPNRPVYFNTEVVLTDGTQTFPYGYTKGLSIRPGQEVTVPVRLQADGPMQSWTLAAAEESNPHLNPDIYNELSFSWDSTEGQSRDVRHLTIRRSAPPDGGTAQVFLRVGITSTSGTTVNESWLVVGTE